MRFLTILCPLFSFMPVVFCNFAILFGRVTRRVVVFMMVYFSFVVVVEEGGGGCRRLKQVPLNVLQYYELYTWQEKYMIEMKLLILKNYKITQNNICLAF